jgi:carbonic anhydrase
VWKLMEGILNFREQMLPKYAERFRKLAAKQTPDALFIACSDSRVMPSLVMSAHPGDLFMMRNVGNLIPPATTDGNSTGDVSEASAIEYAVLVLKISAIIVCGHSECGAMKAVLAQGGRPDAPNLNKWLQHAHPTTVRLKQESSLDVGLKPHDRVSQINVLLQLEHLASYPIVRERVASGALRLHGWWFDVGSGSMYAYDEADGRFQLIERKLVKRMVGRRLAAARHATQHA